MNETLRRAIIDAGLSEVDVAADLGVVPKTVQRWLDGRIPYPRLRRQLANLLGLDEDELWPEVRSARAARSRPEEMRAVYPHRWLIVSDSWRGFFDSAESEIDILVYSGLFLAEDTAVLRVLATRAESGVRVRIALGDPDCQAVAERGVEEGIGDAMAAKVRNALVLYRPFCGADGIEVRLHQTVLYNSLYRADGELLVNQHTYGTPAAHSPVFHLRRAGAAEMFDAHRASFDRIWATATRIDTAATARAL